MDFWNKVSSILFDQSQNWKYLAEGLGITIYVTFFALVIGLVLGVTLSIIRTSYREMAQEQKPGLLFTLLNAVADLFVTVIRGTPTMIQLLIMFNVILAKVDNLVLVAILTFGFNSAAYVSEIFRAGIQAVPAGQKEAARSLGMNYFQTLRKIVLPQAVKISFPALGNEVITLLKETSISGTIGLVDLSRGATIILSNTFNAAVPYFAAALLYLGCVILLEQVFLKIERSQKHA